TRFGGPERNSTPGGHGGPPLQYVPRFFTQLGAQLSDLRMRRGARAKNSPTTPKPPTRPPHKQASQHPTAASQTAACASTTPPKSRIPYRSQSPQAPTHPLPSELAGTPSRVVHRAQYAPQSHECAGSPNKQSLHKAQSLRATTPPPQIHQQATSKNDASKRSAPH